MSLALSEASPPQFSPLVLADRLITLAKEADRAGYKISATRLIGAAYAVLDDGNAVPKCVTGDN